MPEPRAANVNFVVLYTIKLAFGVYGHSDSPVAADDDGLVAARTLLAP